MDTLLVMPKDINELNAINEFFAKLNIKSKPLKLDEQEDYGLLEMMQEVDRTEKVSRESIIDKLR